MDESENGYRNGIETERRMGTDEKRNAYGDGDKGGDKEMDENRDEDGMRIGMDIGIE